MGAMSRNRQRKDCQIQRKRGRDQARKKTEKIVRLDVRIGHSQGKQSEKLKSNKLKGK